MSAIANAAADTLVKVETRSGVKQPFVVIEPTTTPIASVILFTGGNGKIRTHRDGTDIRNGNFLVRTRHLFAGHGLLVAVADVPSDRRRGGGLIQFRTTLDHARDLKGGKEAESDECGSQSEHGFYGIEDLVVADIAAWIKAQAVKQGSRSRR